MLLPHHNTHPLPQSLTLRFSTADDSTRINHALDPAVKTEFDPDEHAVKRLSTAFNAAVEAGCLALLCDETGEVKTLTIAYHVGGTKDTPEHTNFGTSLSLIPGYKSARVVIAALALREWIKHRPSVCLAAGIVPDNAPSIKTYHHALGWKPMTDEALIAAVADAAWQTLPDPSDPSGETPLTHAPEALKTVGWYQCDEEAIARQAQVLLDFMEAGCLMCTQTGGHISIDMTALEQEGITRAKLGEMARSRTAPPPLGEGWWTC